MCTRAVAQMPELQKHITSSASNDDGGSIEMDRQVTKYMKKKDTQVAEDMAKHTAQK